MQAALAAEVIVSDEEGRLVLLRVQKADVQLVGVAALLIATKYEEIYPPTVKDFIYLTDNTYSRPQILAMEQSILFHLQFEI